MNILVLTSVYKDESNGKDDRSTIVVNSFVHDWIKMGHNVIVVHNSHRYPMLIHWLPFTVKDKLAAKLGFFIADYKVIRKKMYEDCGAKVWRLPMLKIIPHHQPSNAVIKRQIKKIVNMLHEENFSPDVIIGHWASPQMEIVSGLREYYPCKNAVVLHGTEYINQSNFPAHKYLKNIDRLGCRSKKQAEDAKKILNLNRTPFVCYSGVPDAYLEQFSLDVEKYENVQSWRFVYVGRLVKYKQIDVVIEALARQKGFNWTLEIVGEGAELEHLKEIVSSLHCEDRIHFRGRVSRDEVMSILRESHFFVMVSKGEVFGLVYLEAMAASCIAIGSIGEGIDGVIIDGENGFLCKPADVDSLSDKIKCIMDMKNIKEIAERGYETAKRLSDSAVAEDYLNTVISGK